MQNLWSRLQLQREACLPQCRVQTESPISPDPSLFCMGSWFFWVQCASIDGKWLSVALYCLLCIVLQHSNIIMAALRSRCGNFIFNLWFLLLSFSSSPNLSLRRLDVYHTWCGLSANLECRSEMCCMRLAENTGCKRSPKIRHLGTIAQFYRVVSSQLRHTSTIGKNLISSNIFFTCPQNMADSGPLTAEIGLGVWGTPANFNGFRVLTSLLQRRRSTEANQTLHDD